MGVSIILASAINRCRTYDNLAKSLYIRSLLILIRVLMSRFIFMASLYTRAQFSRVDYQHRNHHTTFYPKGFWTKWSFYCTQDTKNPSLQI